MCCIDVPKDEIILSIRESTNKKINWQLSLSFEKGMIMVLQKHQNDDKSLCVIALCTTMMERMGQIPLALS